MGLSGLCQVQGFAPREGSVHPGWRSTRHSCSCRNVAQSPQGYGFNGESTAEIHWKGWGGFHLPTVGEVPLTECLAHIPPP